jgi:hypothetical protein
VWAGHLVRTSDDRTVKKVFLEKRDGRRKAGRPKLKWLDSTESDVKWMGVKTRRNKAEDRSVCAIILKEALFKLLRAVCQRRGRKRSRRRSRRRTLFISFL